MILPFSLHLELLLCAFTLAEKRNTLNRMSDFPSHECNMEKQVMSGDNPLPAPPSRETWNHDLPFLDICDIDLSVEQLGRAIVTNNDAGVALAKKHKTDWWPLDCYLLKPNRGSRFSKTS
jgi:hypothetical protein